MKVLDDDVPEGGAGDAFPGVREGVEDEDEGTPLVCWGCGFDAGGETTDGARGGSGSRAGGGGVTGAGFEPPMFKLIVGGGGGGGASDSSGRAAKAGGRGCDCDWDCC